MDTSTTRPATAIKPLPRFRTPVRGYAFAPRPAPAADPTAGQPAILAREPANPADPLAVAVWIDDGVSRWRIGYLDRGVSARVAPRLDRGQTIRARVDGWAVEPDGRWRRPMLLLLPEVPPGPRPEPPTGQLTAQSPEPPTGQPTAQSSAPADEQPTERRPASADDSPSGEPAVSAVDPPSGPPTAGPTSPAAPPVEGSTAMDRGSSPQIWGRPPGVSRRRVRGVTRTG